MKLIPNAAIATIAVFAASFVAASAHAQAETPRRGGVLLVPQYAEPPNYDCHSSTSSSVIHRTAPHYSTLLKIDEKNYPNIVGDAAESWTVSPDHLTYTFKLHSGIRFHDGSPFSSADVKATFERIKSPPQGVVSLRAGQFKDVTSIETPDPLTVVFKLSKPNAAMPIYFASPWHCLYSAAKLAQDPKYPERNVMGTGPFKFVQHVAGSLWEGVRNDDYFIKGKPYLDGFKMFTMTPPAIPNALISGQVQINFLGITPSDREKIKAARPDFVFGDAASPGLHMFTFNTKRPPFDDPRVRRALSLAVDRYAMSKVMARLQFFDRIGGLSRAGSFFARPPEELAKMPGWWTDIAKSRAEAKRLLGEAGVKDLKFVFLNQQNYTDTGIFLIDQWRQIGVTATQETPDVGRFFALRSSGQFDVILDAIQDYADDPSLQLSVFQSSDIARGNISGIIDREADAMFEAQQRETDVEKRKKIVWDLEEHLLNTAFTVPTLWAERIVAADPKVKGYTASPSGLVGRDMQDVWLAQ
jgi:peptide/nickel transport system substrate-binding protein